MKNTALGRSGPLTMMEKAQGYEAFYQYSEHMLSTEFHCHDFYEFYIHVRGGQYFSLDNELYLLKPNQVYIIPPFSMHGLSNINELHGYERAFVNVSLEVLKALGCGQMDLDQRFRACASQRQYSFQLSETDAAQCISWIQQLQHSAQTDNPLNNLTNFSVLLTSYRTLQRRQRQRSLQQYNPKRADIYQQQLYHAFQDGRPGAALQYQCFILVS